MHGVTTRAELERASVVVVAVAVDAVVVVVIYR